eukprot:3062887-Rhodomonas_salina.2
MSFQRAETGDAVVPGSVVAYTSEKFHNTQDATVAHLNRTADEFRLRAALLERASANSQGHIAQAHTAGQVGFGSFGVDSLGGGGGGGGDGSGVPWQHAGVPTASTAGGMPWCYVGGGYGQRMMPMMPAMATMPMGATAGGYLQHGQYGQYGMMYGPGGGLQPQR